MARFSMLRVRLLLIVLLAILPAMGLTLYTGMEGRRYAVGDAQRETLQLARLASASQRRMIEEGHHLLTGLAQLPVVRHRDPDTCSAFFAGLLKQYRRYSNFGVVDPNGDVFCSGVPMNRPVSIAGAPDFLRAVQTREFAVGRFRIGRITRRAMLPLIQPVVGAAKRVRAVVFAALDLGWLNQFAAQVELPPGSTLTVIDRNGTILVHHPSPERWVGESVPEAPIVKAILRQQAEGAVEAVGEDGVPRLYAFTPLRGATGEEDAYLSIGIPSQVAYAQTNRILTRNLAGLGFVAVIALVAAWVGSNVFVLRCVKALVDTTKRLAAGNLSARTGLPHERGELGQLARAFDEMAAALEQNEARQKQAEEELERSLRQLRALSARLQAVREEERIQIAREVHDELGQALTGLKMDLSWLASRLPKDQELLAEKARSMSSLVDGTIHTVREISTQLRPGVLDDLGLVAAIEWQVHDFEARTGIRCRFTSSPEDITLDQDRSTAMFRILQEALTNIARHANATGVSVTLEEKADGIILEVEDNGRGIIGDEISSSKSLGLLGMRERSLVFGGDVNVRGIPGQGTTVTVRIPRHKPGESGEVQ